MATYSIVPIDMIADPNFYSPTASGTLDLVDGNAVTAWFQLQINDNLGLRPFTPATQATISLIFQRANQFSQPFYPTVSQAPIETVQTIIKQGTKSVYNTSLFSVSLTTQDITAIRSGTIQAILINNGVTTNIQQNWFVTKTLTKPGC